MLEVLKKYKRKTLIQLHKFVFRKDVTIGDIRSYATLLSKEPKRTDFISYDEDGNFILNHKPVFRGWSMCVDASSETKKVAKMQTQGNSYKIYFDTASGTTIISLEHMIDHCTYNDLTNLFEGNLEII
jgi:hypothetical protein